MQLIYLPFGCRFGGTLFSIGGLAYRENNEPLDKTFIYEYNDIGNITLVKAYDFSLSVEPEGDCTPTMYEYDTTYPDRLISFNGNAITYNAQGYPTFYKGKNYNWSRGKLNKINIGSSMQTGAPCDECIFTYDAHGQRTKKNYVCDANPGVSGDDSYRCDTTYQYDQSGRLIREHLTERNNDGSPITREFIYLYDETGMIGVMYGVNGSTAQLYYYHRNLQGDVIAIYDASGEKKVEYAYDAWGNCSVVYAADLGLADTNPIRYRGYYFDRETGLYYLNARYYSPEWRRFISPDAADYIDPETPNGLNLYAYCNNDPINYIDPSGHDWEWCTFWTGVGMVITAASAIVLSIATFGAATPLAMTIIAGVTLGAGVLTGINGVATMIEAGTQYNFVRDGVFNGLGWSDSAYNIYASVTKGVAEVGSMILGIYRITPSGKRVMADNEMHKIFNNSQRIQRYNTDEFGKLASRSSWKYSSATNGKGMRAVLNDKSIRFNMNGTRFDAEHFFGAPYWVVSSAPLGKVRWLYLF